MNLNFVLIKPILSEKASIQQEKGKYSFLVNRSATKTDIKRAIKSIYGVEAKEVRIMLTPKKIRLIGKGKPWTKRPVRKKAVVTLAKGKSIDPNNLSTETKKK